MEVVGGKVRDGEFEQTAELSGLPVSANWELLEGNLIPTAVGDICRCWKV